MKTLNLRALSGSLILLAMSLGMALGIWAWVSAHAQKAREEKERVEFAYNAARARLLKTGSERHVIEDNLDAWQTLERRGFINPNQRLAWLEAITNANRSNRLYGLEYTLSAPEPVPPDVARGLPLVQTIVHVKMPILVEDDLTRFLKDLQSHPAGLMRARSCTLTRNGPLPPNMVNQPGLEAECELLWYTLKSPS
jgi:type II secretory pathway pseudopilin PulG